jgi:hypothetical protein
MADEQDNQSSSKAAQDASQPTSNQGASISFDVQGDGPAIAQPKSMACWTTVATTDMCWKNQWSYSIKSTIDRPGVDFQKNSDNNTRPARAFQNCLGLVDVAGMNAPRPGVAFTSNGARK